MTSIEHLTELHQLDNLELLAKQVVEGTIIGLHKSPYHGFSVEFAEHRLYNPGESVKDIDWKVYARTDKLFVKKFEEETNLRCQIVIDSSSSMYYPADKDFKKIHFSIVCAAGLMHLLKKQRDAVGLSVFSDEVEENTRARTTQVHHKLMFGKMEALLKQPDANKRTAAAKCLHQIAETTHRRSLVMIFSDMMDNVEEAEELFSALQHLKYNRHEVVMFHVVDKAHELDFEFENRPYEFVDMETGEKVKLQANQVKDHYVKQMEEYRQALKLKCTQYKIDFVEADIAKDFSQILIPYFNKRKKLY